jgi:hypothetical protein
VCVFNVYYFVQWELKWALSREIPVNPGGQGAASSWIRRSQELWHRK